MFSVDINPVTGAFVPGLDDGILTCAGNHTHSDLDVPAYVFFALSFRTRLELCAPGCAVTAILC